MGKEARGPDKIQLTARLLAELVGTFVLTFVAAGGDIVDQLYPHGIGHVARYLAPGIAVAAMIWALSGISGAHINPAISLAFFFRRSFSAALVPGYIAAQFVGAILAGFTLRVIFKGDIPLGITKPLDPFNTTQAFPSKLY